MNGSLILVLNLEDDSILLNEEILAALDRPKHIQIMINEEEKMLLLRACTLDDREAVVVPENRFEISGRSLLKRIRQMVKWNDNRPRMCRGEYLPAHRAILFSLAGARPLDGPEEYR